MAGKTPKACMAHMLFLGTYDALQLKVPDVPSSKLTKKELKCTVGVTFSSQSQIVRLTPFK